MALHDYERKTCLGVEEQHLEDSVRAEDGARPRSDHAVCRGLHRRLAVTLFM